MNDINTVEAQLRALGQTPGVRVKITNGRPDGQELIAAAAAIVQLEAITVEQAVVLLKTSYQTLRREIGRSPPTKAVVQPPGTPEHVKRPARGRDARKYYDPVKLQVWWAGRVAGKRRPSKTPVWQTSAISPLTSWKTGWVTYGPQSAIVTHITVSGLKVNDFVALFKGGATVEFLTLNEAMQRPWAIHAEWERWFEPWKASLLATLAEAQEKGLQAVLSSAPLLEKVRL